VEARRCRRLIRYILIFAGVTLSENTLKHAYFPDLFFLIVGGVSYAHYHPAHAHSPTLHPLCIVVRIGIATVHSSNVLAPRILPPCAH